MAWRRTLSRALRMSEVVLADNFASCANFKSSPTRPPCSSPVTFLDVPDRVMKLEAGVRRTKLPAVDSLPPSLAFSLPPTASSSRLWLMEDMERAPCSSPSPPTGFAASGECSWIRPIDVAGRERACGRECDMEREALRECDSCEERDDRGRLELKIGDWIIVRRSWSCFSCFSCFSCWSVIIGASFFRFVFHY